MQTHPQDTTQEEIQLAKSPLKGVKYEVTRIPRKISVVLF
jgi:hypothetical protein